MLTRDEKAARDRLTAMLAELTRLRDAMKTAASFGPEWDAYHTALRQWCDRPTGRAAAPGDIWGAGRRDPWDTPSGGASDKCRRCNGYSTKIGHPHGCPRTPGGWGELSEPLQPCYCGATLVVFPETSGACCVDTPPVHVPGGCTWCGSSECRVNHPDDQPEHDYYVIEVIPVRHPEQLTGVRPYERWVHPRCIDEFLLDRGRDDAASEVEKRRQERRAPLGGMRL